MKKKNSQFPTFDTSAWLGIALGGIALFFGLLSLTGDAGASAIMWIILFPLACFFAPFVFLPFIALGAGVLWLFHRLAA